MSNVILSKLHNPYFYDSQPVASSISIPNGRGSKQVMIPSFQSGGFPSMNQIVSIPNSSSVPANAFTTAQKIQFKIPHDQIRRIESVSMRFQITETNAASMILAPVSYWIERVEIWSLGGSGQMLARLYGDNLYFKQCALNSNEQFALLRRNANLDALYQVSAEQTH
jgi:hypothetical protein